MRNLRTPPDIEVLVDGTLESTVIIIAPSDWLLRCCCCDDRVVYFRWLIAAVELIIQSLRSKKSGDRFSFSLRIYSCP